MGLSAPQGEAGTQSPDPAGLSQPHRPRPSGCSLDPAGCVLAWQAAGHAVAVMGRGVVSVRVCARGGREQVWVCLCAGVSVPHLCACAQPCQQVRRLFTCVCACV